jgi:hypothetical protein
MKISINHISVLVKNVKDISFKFVQKGFFVGDIDSFDSEGTEEVYIGPKDGSALLLLQAPIKVGPYMRAYQKRGIGLHHIALDVENIIEFSSFMGEIGWFLHSESLQNFRNGNAIYFVRPGVHTIFEVIERTTNNDVPFITNIKVPIDEGHERFIEKMNINNIQAVGKNEFTLEICKSIWNKNDFE